MNQKLKPAVIQLGSLKPLECPCGESRRAFFNIPEPLASVHLVEIKADAIAHYHKKTTEIYVVLEGEGFIELDGQSVPVKPLSAVYIPPFCRHRAVGKLKILNIPIPPFDPNDEWID
ncbi:MAG: cupin domain-containing protein [Verrucomicrobiia bacterium]